MKSLSAIVPSGFRNMIESPARLSWKEVWSGEPGIRRSFPEANTIRNPLAGRGVAGKFQRLLAGVFRESESVQCSSEISSGPVLWSSIQSGNAPSSSGNVLVFEAMSSLITTAAVAEEKENESQIPKMRQPISRRMGIGAILILGTTCENFLGAVCSEKAEMGKATSWRGGRTRPGGMAGASQTP